MVGYTEEQFTGFKRKHYRVTSGPAWLACKAYRDKRNTVTRTHLAYAESVGGTGCFPGSTANVGNGTPIGAVIFDGSLPQGWKPRRWSSFRGLNSGQTPAWPDKRLTIGKAAIADIMTLPFSPHPDEICDAIGFPTSLTYSKDGVERGSECLGFFEVASVGWLEDVFYVSLPDFAGQKARKESEGYSVEQPDWIAPEGMETILKEEADLDFARARLAKAA